MQPFTINLKPIDKKNKGKNKKKRSSKNVFGEGYDTLSNTNQSKSRTSQSGPLTNKKIKLTEVTQQDFLNTEEPKNERVISLQDNAYNTAAQEMATSEDYNEVPVEEFGSAILRGMGWNGNSDPSDDLKDEDDLKSAHAEGLGIGAKGTNNPSNKDNFMPVVKVLKPNHN